MSEAPLMTASDMDPILPAYTVKKCNFTPKEVAAQLSPRSV